MATCPITVEEARRRFGVASISPISTELLGQNAEDEYIETPAQPPAALAASTSLSPIPLPSNSTIFPLPQLAHLTLNQKDELAAHLVGRCFSVLIVGTEK